MPPPSARMIIIITTINTINTTVYIYIYNTILFYYSIHITIRRLLKSETYEITIICSLLFTLNSGLPNALRLNLFITPSMPSG